MDAIKDLQKEIHQCAIDHGWWDDQRPFAEIVALCHSELSEALEARRAGMADQCERMGKPEGAAIEMADCIIRILDYAEHEGWDMDKIIRDKMEYNKTRPYKHGKLF